MKILAQDIYEDSENEDGYIVIQIHDFVYNIGSNDGESHWIERQSLEDYNNYNDGYEYPEWFSEKDKRINFKFFNLK